MGRVVQASLEKGKGLRMQAEVMWALLSSCQAHLPVGSVCSLLGAQHIQCFHPRLLPAWAACPGQSVQKAPVQGAASQQAQAAWEVRRATPVSPAAPTHQALTWLPMSPGLPAATCWQLWSPRTTGMVAALAMATITVAPSISIPQGTSPPLCRQGWKTAGKKQNVVWKHPRATPEGTLHLG